MKKLIYQVYVGKKSRLYDCCTKSVKEYADKIGTDYVCQTTPILRIKPDIFTTNRSPESYEKYGGYLPIYEKENAFGYFDRYDQISIIDADVYVRLFSYAIRIIKSVGRLVSSYSCTFYEYGYYAYE